MRQPLTKKEKAARLRQTLFTGRVDDLALFRSMLPLDRQIETDILVIYGIGGIGKSALLEEYRRICAEMNVPTALVDGQAQRSILSILLTMETQLRAMNLAFPQFEEGLKRYKTIQSKLVGQADIPQKVITMLSRGLFHAAKALPPAHAVAEVVGEENIRMAMDTIFSAVGRKDGEFFFRPEEELTTRLLTDLGNHTAERRLVIMFDTYELMDALDDWVRDDLFANLSGHALLVIAGRHKLEGKAWAEFFPLMIQRELSGLDATEAQEYLRRRGVEDASLASKMVTFADGHPLTLALLSELAAHTVVSDLAQVPDRRDIVKELIERIVGHVENDLRTALEVLSVLRYSTEESLAHMLDSDIADISGLFSEVRDLGFVKMHNGGLTLHETVRTALAEDLQWRAPERYQRLHTRAAQYFGKGLDKANGEDQERGTLEWLYHHVHANEEEGMELFQEQAEKLVGYYLRNRLRTLLDEAYG